jgi:hypothetical protein
VPYRRRRRRARRGLGILADPFDELDEEEDDDDRGRGRRERSDDPEDGRRKVARQYARLLRRSFRSDVVTRFVQQVAGMADVHVRTYYSAPAEMLNALHDRTQGVSYAAPPRQSHAERAWDQFMSTKHGVARVDVGFRGVMMPRGLEGQEGSDDDDDFEPPREGAVPTSAWDFMCTFCPLLRVYMSESLDSMLVPNCDRIDLHNQENMILEHEVGWLQWARLTAIIVRRTKQFSGKRALTNGTAERGSWEDARLQRIVRQELVRIGWRAEV